MTGGESNDLMKFIEVNAYIGKNGISEIIR